MAGEAELGQEAVDLAQQTSYSWDTYLGRIRSDKDYDYRNTNWYRAGAKLEQAKYLEEGTGAQPSPPPPNYLDSARARIFLAQTPLDCLAAPPWMTPVCSADHGYRDQGETNYYTQDVIDQLRDFFGVVESWADCRVPSGWVKGEGTGYDEAVRMAEEFGLDGAWGQCENQGEFDNAYAGGATRMIGNIGALNWDSQEKVARADILLSVELYRNVMPWMTPDWKGCNDGIGGNCIACYASETEGAVYTPVQEYRDLGLYVPRQDSVYGVGLKSQDWLHLA